MISIPEIDHDSYFCDLGQIDERTEVWGGKAVSLSRLIKNGYNVPRGFVVSSEAYNRLYLNKQDPTDFFIELRRWMSSYFTADDKIIFRSSASLENNGRYTACGIFESSVCSAGNGLKNLKKVWASADTEYAKAYLKLIDASYETVRMAVIVQKFEKRKFSSVIQSRDIINGQDSVVIEFVSGDHDSVVTGKKNAKVIRLDRYADIVEGKNRDFSYELLEKIVRDVKNAEAIFGGPVEIEAQIDESSISYLQVRNLL